MPLRRGSAVSVVRQRSVVERLNLLMELARGPQGDGKPRRRREAASRVSARARCPAQRRQAPATAEGVRTSDSRLEVQRSSARLEG